MKNLKSLIMFVVLAAFVYACQPGTKKEPAPDKPITTISTSSSNPLDTIPLDTFKNWVKTWKKNQSGYIDSLGIKYFNMPLIDLNDIVNENADSARLYMGLETLSPEHYAAHIMIVGMVNGSPDLSMIADYTDTCPPWCDTVPSFH